MPSHHHIYHTPTLAPLSWDAARSHLAGQRSRRKLISATSIAYHFDKHLRRMFIDLPLMCGQSDRTVPLAVFAACEAIIGLTIEISFIATFTQHYFGK